MFGFGPSEAKHDDSRGWRANPFKGGPVILTERSADVGDKAIKGPRIYARAGLGQRTAPFMRWHPAISHSLTTLSSLSLLCALVTGCSWLHHGESRDATPSQPLVVVVAPVLNLSGSRHVDTLKVTDLVASELQTFENVAVIPVNLTLAALERRGLRYVETSTDACDLAAEFGADATIVTAITEYDPYNPPVVGLVMQWYASPLAGGATGFNPVSASRQAAGHAENGYDVARSGPLLQVQQVFNAAHDQVLDEVREYAAKRDGHQSPYGWRRYVRAQELYVRYSCWSLIRTMLSEREQGTTTAVRGKVSS